MKFLIACTNLLEIDLASQIPVRFNILNVDAVYLCYRFQILVSVIVHYHSFSFIQVYCDIFLVCR